MTIQQQTRRLPSLARLAILLAITSPAFAAPSVVYVVFNGSDANVCTRSAPCKTITHALTVVASDGVVDIAASGLYDTFTITQSVSVEADPGVRATIDVPASGTGITVNAASTSYVALRNLSVWGSASGTGIQANSGAKVLVENCVSRDVSYGLVLNSTTTAFKITGGNYQGSDTSVFIRAGGNPIVMEGVTIQGSSSNAAIDLVGVGLTITHSLLAGDGGSGFLPGLWVKGGSTAVMENDVISGYGPGVQVGGGLPCSFPTTPSPATRLESLCPWERPSRAATTPLRPTPRT